MNVNSLNAKLGVIQEIGTSQLICSENQLTGFYIMATWEFNELIKYQS